MPHMKKSRIDTPLICAWFSDIQNTRAASTIPRPDLQVIEMLSLTANCCIKPMRTVIECNWFERHCPVYDTMLPVAAVDGHYQQLLPRNVFIRSVAFYPRSQSNSLTNTFQGAMPSLCWNLQITKCTRARFPRYPCCWNKKAARTVEATHLKVWRNEEGVLLLRQTRNYITSNSTRNRASTLRYPRGFRNAKDC